MLIKFALNYYIQANFTSSLFELFMFLQKHSQHSSARIKAVPNIVTSVEFRTHGTKDTDRVEDQPQFVHAQNRETISLYISSERNTNNIIINKPRKNSLPALSTKFVIFNRSFCLTSEEFAFTLKGIRQGNEKRNLT